jgi:hypothetical protein
VGVAQKLLLSDRAASSAVAFPLFTAWPVGIGEASSSDKASLLIPGLESPDIILFIPGVSGIVLGTIVAILPLSFVDA